jgi:hypothetical protein
MSVIHQNRRLQSTLIYLFLCTLFLSACQADWAIPLTSDGIQLGRITTGDVTFYADLQEDETDQVPLEQLLYHHGLTLIDSIHIIEEDEVYEFGWQEIALNSQITKTGQVWIGEQVYHPASIDIVISERLSEVEMSIIDIAPTMANALGLPVLPDAMGTNQLDTTAENGVLILLDGLQYQKLKAFIAPGELQFFTQDLDIHTGLTVYPPITTVASAAVLTGASPQKNGVFGYGFRSTELTTLFDLASDAGRSVVAVEGASLPFNLRSAETTLSGDRDGDGFSDDEVCTNAINVIQAGLPDLLYIHFHEIDDAGHNAGPDSEQYQEAFLRVDSCLAELIHALPENTLVILFADHGMHAEGEGGTHGNLITSDLIVPIIFYEKK